MKSMCKAETLPWLPKTVSKVVLSFYVLLK